MARYLILWACLFLIAAPVLTAAQKTAPGIPSFKIAQTNGRFFEAKGLEKGKPVVLVYFAPDCGHCQVLMDGLFKNIAAFAKTQLVLVTFKPARELLLFERQYKTASYPNIKTGTEGTTFFLRYHYHLQQTPFTAVYNKQGALACSFRNINTPIADIVSCVRHLK